MISRYPLVRSNVEAHTTALDRPVSDLDLRAINAVQETPWRINRYIQGLMANAVVILEAQRAGRSVWGDWDFGLPLPGIATAKVVPLPDRIDEATWQAMDPEDRKEHLKARGKVHAQNASVTGKNHAFLDKLLVASELVNRESIWFPHTRCFRGRIYPLAVNGPQPQGNDVSKALLMFSEGMPLGPDGLYWLCIRAANCFGMDKLPLVERVQWTLDHRAEIETSALAPMECLWWSEGAEPWQFLATCHELVQVWQMEDPETFVSHLPIPLDGSCNGIQHLSAMGLDPVGALATNLRSDRPRQDIYAEVAAHVQAAVERDAAAGVEAALAWHGRVDRSTCKRAVMCTPYGVTDQGIRTQLIADGHVPDELETKGPAADYLRDRLVEALGATIEAGRGIMAWLQTTASRLADAGLPFDWTTPSGSHVRQAYHVRLEKRVETLVGCLKVHEEGTGLGLNSRKQALGSAPNFVHSFDAAHLAMTVVACADEGIRSFAMIHDSFGTHAGETTRLSRVLREQFVAIYQEDWLGKTLAGLKEYAGHVEFPPLPKRGSFDVSEVLEAPFFFS